jgi:internalin A
VRTQLLIEGKTRWRTGVVLEFEGNRALVKADVHDRKIFISVTGPAAGRRRLLAVIRSDLERIHGDIKKLQVTEMVPVLGRKDAVVPYSELTVFEKNGIWKVPRVFGGEPVQLDVRELLDGVDIEGYALAKATSITGPKPSGCSTATRTRMKRCAASLRHT